MHVPIYFCWANFQFKKKAIRSCKKGFLISWLFRKNRLTRSTSRGPPDQLTSHFPKKDNARLLIRNRYYSSKEKKIYGRHFWVLVRPVCCLECNVLSIRQQTTVECNLFPTCNAHLKKKKTQRGLVEPQNPQLFHYHFECISFSLYKGGIENGTPMKTGQEI